MAYKYQFVMEEDIIALVLKINKESGEGWRVVGFSTENYVMAPTSYCALMEKEDIVE